MSAVWRSFARACVVALLASVAGCSLGVDGEQSRLCRQIIAGLESADGIEVLRVRAVAQAARARRGPGEGVDIRYRLRPSTGMVAGPERSVTCLFDPSRPTAKAIDRIVAVETGAGPLSASRLYMLKRFWLETIAGAADPEPIAGADRVPEIARPLAVLLQAVLAGVPQISLLALLAAAYALIYGLVGRINLAFGDLVTVGGYAALIGIALAGGSLAIVGIAVGSAIVLGLWAGGIVSAVTGRRIFEPLDRVSGQAPLIASAGLAIVLSEAVRLARMGGPRSGPPILNEPLALARAGDFIVAVPPVVFLAALLAGAGLLLLLLGLKRSGFGRAWRASADDPLAAALMGIAPASMHAATFLAAGLLAGIGGVISALTYGSIAYAGGLVVGLKALIASLIGGAGSIGGAILCGALIGLAEAAWSAMLPIEHRDAMLFTLLIVILLARPGGLFGVRGLEPRR